MMYADFLPNDEKLLERKLQWIKLFDKYNINEPVNNNQTFCINTKFPFWEGNEENAENNENAENAEISDTEEDDCLSENNSDDDDDDEMSVIPPLELDIVKGLVQDRENVWKKTGFDKLIDSTTSEKEIRNWLSGQQSIGETTESTKQKIIKNDEKSKCLTITTTTTKKTVKYMHSLFNNQLAILKENNNNTNILLSTPSTNKLHQSRDMSRRCNPHKASKSNSSNKENDDTKLLRKQYFKSKNSPPSISQSKKCKSPPLLTSINNKRNKNINMNKGKMVKFHRVNRMQSEKTYLRTPYPKKKSKSRYPNLNHLKNENKSENEEYSKSNSNEIEIKESAKINERLRPRKNIPIYTDMEVKKKVLKKKKINKNTKSTKLPTKANTNVNVVNEIPSEIFDNIKRMTISNERVENIEGINNIPIGSNNKSKEQIIKNNVISSKTTTIDQTNNIASGSSNNEFKKPMTTMSITSKPTTDVQTNNIPSGSGNSEFKKPISKIVPKSKKQQLRQNPPKECANNHITKSSFLNSIDGSNIEFQPVINSTAKGENNNTTSVSSYSICPDMVNSILLEFSQKEANAKQINQLVKEYEKSDTSIDFLDFIQQF